MRENQGKKYINFQANQIELKKCSLMKTGGQATNTKSEIIKVYIKKNWSAQLRNRNLDNSYLVENPKIGFLLQVHFKIDLFHKNSIVC